MNVIIRVDSSEIIGSGHVMRCLAMAERLKADGAEVYFICRNLIGNIIDEITKQGYKCYILKATISYQQICREGYLSWLTVSQKQDAEDTINTIIYNNITADRLVVDHYALDIEWESMLRPHVNEIFVIDDLANRHHDCDILLDQDSYSNKEERYIGLVPRHCKMLLGHKYALLRTEFVEAKKKMRKRTGIIKKIIIFYGGSDATNETMKTIHAIAPLVNKYNLRVDVVIGKSNRLREDIKCLCDGMDGFSYHCQVNNMAQMMSEADFSFGAGGITLWERLYLDLPGLVIAVADNQVKICEECYTQGLIDYLGQADTVTQKEIYDRFLIYLSRGV